MNQEIKIFLKQKFKKHFKICYYTFKIYISQYIYIYLEFIDFSMIYFFILIINLFIIHYLFFFLNSIKSIIIK